MRKTAVVLVVALGLTATSTAFADPPPCAALPDEPATPIAKLYIENGDTQEPMIKRMGKALIQATPPIRLIYRNRPTCSIRQDLYQDATMHVVQDGATLRPVKYVPIDTTADTVECSVPATDTGAVPIQLGIGATYLSSCTDAIPSPDAAVDQFPGPVQAYGFITHNDSTQNGITAEEGYLSYGFTEGNGYGTGDTTPWVVQELRFKRSNTASTTLTMSAAIHLTPAQMTVGAAPALSPETSAELMTVVAAANNPEAALGILGMDLRDANRSLIKMLPFRTFNQRYAYYPDKTKDTFDKQNVRDGHYAPWAPTPYISKKDAATGKIADPLAKRFYDLVMGNVTEAAVNGLAIIAQSGLVPACAMKVTRAGDGADLQLYTAANPNPFPPCGCSFEKNVPSGTTSCTVCTDDTPCGGGKCRFGYCEAN